MAGKSAEQDNSIEEILASIRQIISEDDPKAPPAGVMPEPAPVAAPAPQAAIDDVFELVDRVVAEEEPEVESDAPASVFSPERLPPVPEPVPAPEPVVQAPPPPPPPPPPAPPPVSVQVALRDHVSDVPAPVEVGPIFTDGAAAATLGAFSKLSDTILLERQRAIAGASITLEDIVKELLSPLLREWIDKHVPDLVERLVREELEKITRST